ncbi:MAG: hypothetical protein ACK502_00950 [Alphaproteobacteria bacterium]
MTKKRAKGAPRSFGDTGVRGESSSEFTHRVVNFILPSAESTTPPTPTVPDVTNTARNLARRRQLQLFRSADNHYEREYTENLLRELKSAPQAIPAASFKAFFTDGDLKLEDVSCECTASPDAKNLESLIAVLPKINITKNATVKVSLTNEQYAQLDAKYTDRAISEHGRGGIG